METKEMYVIMYDIDSENHLFSRHEMEALEGRTFPTLQSVWDEVVRMGADKDCLSIGTMSEFFTMLNDELSIDQSYYTYVYVEKPIYPIGYLDKEDILEQGYTCKSGDVKEIAGTISRYYVFTEDLDCVCEHFYGSGKIAKRVGMSDYFVIETEDGYQVFDEEMNHQGDVVTDLDVTEEDELISLITEIIV